MACQITTVIRFFRPFSVFSFILQERYVRGRTLFPPALLFLLIPPSFYRQFDPLKHRLLPLWHKKERMGPSPALPRGSTPAQPPNLWGSLVHAPVILCRPAEGGLLPRGLARPGGKVGPAGRAWPRATPTPMPLMYDFLHHPMKIERMGGKGRACQGWVKSA